MKHLLLPLLYCLLLSCSKAGSDEPIINPDSAPGSGDVTVTEPENPQGVYSELYRPQIHYSPSKNWVNDPNGMVYVDGFWHLFYQYNPYGNEWGNMSWGHAISADLVHWQELPVALQGDELGAIFSGSAVVDKENTAGFGTDAVVAFYTSAGEHQQQSMAYSLDGLESFTKYSANPVIANNNRPDFRDPKVFWHEPTHQWVMVLALGWSCGIEIWTSRNLRSWQYASTFRTDIKRCNNSQWECPDLIELPYEGGTKWVLIVNVNPGGPNNGSGIQYFIGDFDGKNFTADSLDYPLWMDTGMDNYAGVTWNNAPDGRKILIGWINNWLYAGNLPCSPWRSAFTLPRELSLVNIGGKPYIANKVVSDLEKIAGPWKELSGTTATLNGNLSAYQLQVTIPTTEFCSISLSNETGEKFEMTTNAIYHIISVNRTSATGTSPASFSIPSVKGKLIGDASFVTLDIYVDQSSVEVFSADGTFTMTNLVFPSKIYNMITVPLNASGLRYRTLDSIWK